MRSLKLFTVAAAVTATLLGAAGCTTRVDGASRGTAPHLSIVPLVGTEPLPDAPIMDAPVVDSATALVGLDTRELQAAKAAANTGATISTAVLDRNTGQLIANGANKSIPIASVAKLFIADDLLLQVAKGQTELGADDLAALGTMLRSSDDSIANDFWNRSGGNAVISRVSARYGLTGTTVPYDGNWWTTMSTATDLVTYYDKLLSGSGGLPRDKAAIILSSLAQSTPNGTDGYPQRFGIPDGLYGEPVAVKQGWMPGWAGNNWMHLSTGVVGADHRYVMAIGALQPTDDASARATITDAVKTMFPGGRIG